MEILLKILCVGLAVTPVSCFVNLAQLPQYRGQASQSSTYPKKPWTADKAVDGYLQYDNNESTCSFTRNWASITAWWKFSLRKSANVAYLENHFRNRCCPYAHFGENCSRCGLCQDGLCDVFNGSCIQGCSTHGMDPPLCIRTPGFH
ncbi:uncharacterized protein LOC130049224 [Ostrea edulis]|uniref:uncharacterized protein LOC130049224 n=1 Tax=Ostrea edulis TaxID=37623 RepID=UPI0024AED674|nr:uncharacterized protein LOC130049224 [Ostrea edulis]